VLNPTNLILVCSCLENNVNNITVSDKSDAAYFFHGEKLVWFNRHKCVDHFHTDGKLPVLSLLCWLSLNIKNMQCKL
jgi:hypothetical protein